MPSSSQDQLSFSGCSWRAGLTASDLITSGRLPPFIIAGLDNSGALRSYDYLPYKPGTGVGGFRAEAAAWPGGGVDAFADSLVAQVLPLVRSAFGATSDPRRTVLGGSSFGGIAALAVARRHPVRWCVWGGILAFTSNGAADYQTALPTIRRAMASIHATHVWPPLQIAG